MTTPIAPTGGEIERLEAVAADLELRGVECEYRVENDHVVSDLRAADLRFVLSALRAEKAKSEGLREAAEDAYRTLAQAFSRIHGLPRSTDTALATQIGQTRARIEAALQPTEEMK